MPCSFASADRREMVVHREGDGEQNESTAEDGDRCHQLRLLRSEVALTDDKPGCLVTTTVQVGCRGACLDAVRRSTQAQIVHTADSDCQEDGTQSRTPPRVDPLCAELEEREERSGSGDTCEQQGEYDGNGGVGHVVQRQLERGGIVHESDWDVSVAMDTKEMGWTH